MNAIKVEELAEEYRRFKNVVEEDVDLIDHIKLYESLVSKLEKAGLSFYDVNRYIHLADV